MRGDGNATREPRACDRFVGQRAYCAAGVILANALRDEKSNLGYRALPQ